MSSEDEDASDASELRLQKRRNAYAKREAKRKNPDEFSPARKHIRLSDVPHESKPQWQKIWKRVARVYTFDPTKSNEVKHMVFEQWKQTQYDTNYTYDGQVDVTGLAVTINVDNRISANKRRCLKSEVTLVC